MKRKLHDLVVEVHEHHATYHTQEHEKNMIDFLALMILGCCGMLLSTDLSQIFFATAVVIASIGAMTWLSIMHNSVAGDTQLITTS